MSEQAPGRRDECARYAHILALVDVAPDDAGRDAPEWRAAQAHMAGCAHCQADQRAYARLDADLRRAYGPTAVSPLRTADLLAAIGATEAARLAGPAPEPSSAAPGWASHAAPATIRSVLYLGDFDDVEGLNPMSDDDARDEVRKREAAETTSSAPARKLAAIPSLRPGPDERLGWQRWTIGFSAMAAVVMLAVIAATLFGGHGRSAASRTAAAATQTAAANSQASAAPSGPLAAISMDSATDGWAIGNASWQQGGSSQDAIAAFYHYDGAQWRLVQRVKGFAVQFGNHLSFKMFSSTDGWAFDGIQQALHFDGTSWRPMSLTLAGSERITRVMALDMVSPSEGWAAAYINGGAAGSGAIGFLRYDGQQWGRQWSVEPSDFAAPGVAMSTLTVNVISSGAVGDAWAIGSAFRQVSDGQGTSQQVGFIFHRVDGVWRIAQRLNQPDAAVDLVPEDIVMLSPTLGWIVGETLQFEKEVDGSFTEISHALMLQYDAHTYGPQWRAVPAPIASPSANDQLRQIVARGTDDVWVNGASAAAMVTPSGVQVSTLLLRYDGARWSLVTPDVPISGVNYAGIAAISIAPDGALWAVGSATKVVSGPSGHQGIESPLAWRYAGGAWSAVTISGGK